MYIYSVTTLVNYSITSLVIYIQLSNRSRNRVHEDTKFKILTRNLQFNTNNILN